jgi:uncharacterized Tic20 family protein
MNNLPLDRSICRRAMWCHLSGLTWLYLQPLNPLLILNNSPSLQGELFKYWMFAVFLLPFFIPFLLWRINRRLHPFVDLAGKATVNFILTIFFQFIILISLDFLISVMSCGVGYVFALSLFANVLMVGSGLILLTHFVSTIYAAIRATRGEVYNYPFAMTFF